MKQGISPAVVVVVIVVAVLIIGAIGYFTVLKPSGGDADEGSMPDQDTMERGMRDLENEARERDSAGMPEGSTMQPQ